MPAAAGESFLCGELQQKSRGVPKQGTTWKK